MDEAALHQAHTSCAEPEAPWKHVVVSLGEHNRKVDFSGDVSDLAKATIAVYRDILREDTKLFFQLYDKECGLHIDIKDTTEVRDGSVIKALIFVDPYTVRVLKFKLWNNTVCPEVQLVWFAGLLCGYILLYIVSSLQAFCNGLCSYISEASMCMQKAN